MRHAKEFLLLPQSSLAFLGLEILTLNFFTHCLQQDCRLRAKIMGTDGNPTHSASEAWDAQQNTTKRSNCRHFDVFCVFQMDSNWSSRQSFRINDHPGISSRSKSKTRSNHPVSVSIARRSLRTCENRDSGQLALLAFPDARTLDR